jgi:hypothetical protein
MVQQGKVAESWIPCGYTQRMTNRKKGRIIDPAFAL